MTNPLFVYCDNWWVEGKLAYICVRKMGAVLSVDMDEQRCELVTSFPQCKESAQLTNSFCIKLDNFIFCIPYEETNIGYYDLDKDVWETIETGCRKRMIICTDTYQACEGRIWLAEYYGKKIYQINLKDRVLEKQYCISSGNECIHGEYVVVGMNLYCVVENCIYCIDTSSSEIFRYQILDAEDELYTICYDGCNFWLSGNTKEICIWNPNEGIIRKIYGLEELGYFNWTNKIIKNNLPVFLHSVVIGSHIWYIPLQANMPIIYIDTTDYQIHIFEIAKEKESEKSLVDRGSGFKYIFLYTREDRYIGLFSHKNEIIWEIDTISLRAEEKTISFNKKVVEALVIGYYGEGIILQEGKISDELAYAAMIRNEVGQSVELENKAGSKIYHSVGNIF